MENRISQDGSEGDRIQGAPARAEEEKGAKLEASEAELCERET